MKSVLGSSASLNEETSATSEVSYCRDNNEQAPLTVVTIAI